MATFAQFVVSPRDVICTDPAAIELIPASVYIVLGARVTTHAQLALLKSVAIVTVRIPVPVSVIDVTL